MNIDDDQLFKQIIDLSDDAYWLGSLKETFYLNAAFRKLWHVDEASDSSAEPFLMHIHDDDKKETLKLYHLDPITFSAEYRLQIGIDIIKISISSFILGDHGNIICRKIKEIPNNIPLKPTTDLQGRKSIKEAFLLQQSKQAEMGNMMNIIASQWKEPLNMISMSVQSLLMLKDKNQLSREMLLQIEDQTLKELSFIDNTINEFKNLFHTSSKKEEFLLGSLVKQTVDMVLPYSQKLGIEMNISEVQIRSYGYPYEYKQVLLSILSNAIDAIKSMRGTNPRIDIKIQDLKNRSRLIICDNAGGVPENLLPEKLFEPHVSSKGSDATGMGLYISKAIVENKMQGKISCRNTKDGACFVIETPSRFDQSPSYDKTVIIAEDDEIVRTTLHFFLKKRVKNVILASDGQEALNYFNAHSVDLVITDINMPEMNGNELIKNIRNKNDQIPIVVLTAYKEDIIHHRLVDEVVLKPVIREPFLEVVDSLLGK